MNKEFLKMQKLAGLLTENQMREMMDDKKVPLTPEVKKYIDEAIAELRNSQSDEEWARLERASFWENEFTEGVWEHFEDKFPGALDVNNDVKDYIDSIVYRDQVKEIIGDIDDTPSPDGDFDPKDYADDNGNDKFAIIDGIVGRDLYDNFINAVEAIQDATIGQAGIEPQDIYDYLTDSMLRDA